jgi:hypothetical protein
LTCRQYLLPVKVLSRLFRPSMPEMPIAAHAAVVAADGLQWGESAAAPRQKVYFELGRFWLALDCDVPAPRIFPHGSALAF